jgi:hypothetical protein
VPLIQPAQSDDLHPDCRRMELGLCFSSSSLRQGLSRLIHFVSAFSVPIQGQDWQQRADRRPHESVQQEWDLLSHRSFRK